MALSQRRSTGISVWLSAATKPWPGKCLPQLAMPARSRPCIRLLASIADDTRVAVEGAVADDAAGAVVEVEHRREAEVDAAGAQFGAEHVAGGGGGVGGAQRVVHPQFAQGAHRRQVREAVGAEALHAAAFVVDADQHVGAHVLDGGGELGELAPVLPVAREQDQAAGERVLQAAAVGRRQRGAGDVEHDGGVGGCSGHVVSTTTKDAV